MKQAIFVNGVPASGKSRVARGLSARFRAPLLALDTVKEPMFGHFGTGDREHNRKLGRASYEIIFSVLSDWPDPSLVVIDAWFGFQPMDVLIRHIATAGLGRIAEIWCHAPGAVLAERYGARLGTRSAGHPGADYIPELVALNESARPTGLGPCFHVDTTVATPFAALLTWVATALEIDPVPERDVIDASPPRLIA